MSTEKGPGPARGLNTRRLKHIRMPDAVEAAIKAYAASEHITFNAAVVHFLKEGLSK
jgi:hypothetical protein